MTRITYGLIVAAALSVSGCSNESGDPSATEKALEELQAKYDELTGDQFDDPAQWAAEDIENIGDWEYLVREFADTAPADLEAELNALGDDRWEVYWLERTDTGYVVFLKKPAISYLSKIPLSQIGRYVIGGGDQAE